MGTYVPGYRHGPVVITPTGSTDTRPPCWHTPGSRIPRLRAGGRYSTDTKPPCRLHLTALLADTSPLRWTGRRSSTDITPPCRRLGIHSRRIQGLRVGRAVCTSTDTRPPCRPLTISVAHGYKASVPATGCLISTDTRPPCRLRSYWLGSSSHGYDASVLAVGCERSTDTRPPCRRDVLDGYDASVSAVSPPSAHGYNASVLASEQGLFAEGPA